MPCGRPRLGSRYQASPCSRTEQALPLNEKSGKEHLVFSPRALAMEKPGDFPALYHAASLPCSQGAAECVGTSVASFPSHPLKWESCQSHLHVSSQDPSRMGCALRICQLPPAPGIRHHGISLWRSPSALMSGWAPHLCMTPPSALMAR